MTAWRSEGRRVERVPLLDVDDLAARLEADDPPVVLDVRKADEYEEGHIPGSLHIPYEELPDRLAEVPTDRPLATICSGGKRSGLAASLLQREGFERVLHVGRGGIRSWEEQGELERGA